MNANRESGLGSGLIGDERRATASWAALALGLLFSLEWCARAVSAAPEGVPVLRLVWYDTRGRAEALRPEVVAEIDRLMKDAGIGVAWTIWDGRQREAHEGEIYVVVEAEPAPPLAPNVMGGTQRGSRYLAVYVGSVRRALRLGHEAPDVPGSAACGRLARALARVIAHELGHVGAPARPHSDGGLMAAALGQAFLADPEVVLEDDVRLALRAAATQKEEVHTLSAAARTPEQRTLEASTVTFSAREP
jgi:hypothetical protein